MNPIKTAYGWFFFHSSFSWPLGRYVYDDPRPLENLAYWNFGVFAGGAEAVAMVAAIAAAASSERGVTGAVGVGGEARGGTFHMNQSSEAAVMEAWMGRAAVETWTRRAMVVPGRRRGGCSPPSRSGAKGVVVLPHIACMSAFHSA